ncbi:hypothetical protein KSS82_16080 [Vibrio mimicus]|nr:hypothetical protein [Vibrio mimicus]QXC56789.1 hypothetical protein KSS82_16080 [Vibrio mimicus]
MKRASLVLFASLFTSQWVWADTAADITPSATFDIASCSDDTVINEYLKNSADLINTLTYLLKTCPQNTLKIASLAASQNPLLTREIYTALFQQTSQAELVQTAVDAVKSVQPEQRSDVVQAAIESAPQDLAQAIVDAIAEAGLMDPADILIAAIAGGADPAAIAQPTAAGIATPPPIALAPGSTNTFGTGNGNGGGTASPN